VKRGKKGDRKRKEMESFEKNGDELKIRGMKG
jgi:hypothetical protein